MKRHYIPLYKVGTYLKFTIIMAMIIVNAIAMTAQISTPREFEYIPTRGASINSIFSDSHGRTLAASSDGLLIYDGKDFKGFTENSKGVVCDENIYAALPISDDNLMLCSANGLYRLELHTDVSSFIYETASLDVRAIVRQDSSYVILSTMTGLVTVNTDNMQTRRIKEVPQKSYLSLLAVDKKIYAGFDEGILVYSPETKHSEIISLIDSNNNEYVTTMAFDKIRNCLWIGTNTGILKYSINTGVTQRRTHFDNINVNAILVDGVSDIWIGSHSGLFVFNDEADICTHYTHNALDRLSLADNYVKALFEDDYGNIWIGTEVGVSFCYRNSNFAIERWSHLSSTSEGNRITSILVDTSNNLWMGGTNGLLRHNENKMPHNSSEGHQYFPGQRINHIFEDTDKDIWISTNNGPYLYDRSIDNFIKFSISDSKGKYSAVDCTNIFEDSTGCICLSTRGNGIFIIDKKSVTPQYPNAPITASRHLFRLPDSDELISHRMSYCVMDHNGDLWAAAGVDGLTKIYTNTERIEYFSFSQSEKHLSVKDILSIHCDDDGIIWVAGKGTLDRIDPTNDAITHISNILLEGKAVNSVIDKDANIWLLYPDGILVLNKDSYQMMNVDLPETNYSCLTLDKKTGLIWAGAMDNIIQFSPEAILMPSSISGSLNLTSISINNQEIFPEKEYDGNIILHQSLPYTHSITLKPFQNNLDLDFSGVKADKGNIPRYRYRITHSDDDWREIAGQTFRITLNNLSSGIHTLQIQQLDHDGSVLEKLSYELKIKVLPHWYLSIWSKIIYALVAIALIVWVVKYNYVKNRLKFERLEKEKVTELSNLKINFLTDIAHELKTPLSLILDPLNKLIGSTRNTEQKATLQVARKNALHLGKLVNQVLNLQNADMEELKEKTYPLELIEFIGSMVSMFQEIAESHKIKISFTSNVRSQFIMTDALKLELILRNLISNALKFTTEGGEIDVSVEVINTDVSHGNTGKSIMMTVTDNGVGIPAEDIPKIFDRFYQSKRSLSINKDGSGIGLSVVKTYVTQFNGEIQVKSQLDKGTSFIITMPLVEPENVSMLPYDEDAPDSESKEVKVLIVEDNVDIAKFISDNLGNMVCKTAHNGKSGFEMAKFLNPDVIISDIMMPVMDGIEMCRRLKNNPSTSAIPIILLTAKDDRHTEYDAYSIGADAFISKPFQINHLVIRIKQLLKNRQAARSVGIPIGPEDRTAITIDSLATPDERFRDEITKIIEQHIDDPELNVQRLADLSGINSKQIYRKIKLTTGSTAVDYIKSIRMKKAAQLLSQRQFTVSEVMYMVGFSSNSYFSKCFMEKYGKSPKNYMDEAINKL